MGGGTEQVMGMPGLDKKEQKQRTLNQNRALYLYFTHLAAALNASGFDMKRTLKQDAEIPWTPELVKEFLWRPLQNALLNKESTTELTTKEIDEVLDVLTRHLGEKLGISVEFPSVDSLINQKRN